MKKIRFPLEMAEGKMVKELDELQEYFDLEKALEYFQIMENYRSGWKILTMMIF